jgi:hypothetical protein
VFGPSPAITIGSTVDTQHITSTGFHSFNVLSIVQGWASGTQNNGFFLSASDGIVPFADTDSPFIGVGPMLSVVVDDTVPPVIATTPHDRTLSVGADGKLAIPDLVAETMATDNTGIATIGQSPAAGTMVGPGMTSVTITVLDLAGLSAQAHVTITAADTTKPAFTQPDPLTLTADPVAGTATVPDVATSLAASDNVGIATRMQSPAAGSTLPLGESTITVTLADAAGNSTTVEVPVEVDYDRPDNSAAATPSGLSQGPAPTATGLPAGATIASFAAPAISGDRTLAALAQLKSGHTLIPAIYTSDAAGVDSLVAFKGSDAGLGTGITFKALQNPLLSSSGAIAFGATVQGTGITAGTDHGVWSDVFGSGVRAILREGAQVPGLPAGVLLNAVSSYSLHDGGVLALVTLHHGAGGVTAANDTALILQAGANAGVLVAREGTALTTGGSPVKTIGALNPAVLSPGEGRSQADDTAIAKVTLQNGDVSIVKLKSGAAVPLVSSGDPALAGPYGSFWHSFGVPATDAAGTQLVFSGGLKVGQGSITAANDSVLAYSDDDTTFSFLAREGGTATDIAGAAYTGFYDPLVNSSGEIAFLATIKGTGVTKANRLGLWFGMPGSYHLLARRGSAAPGANGTALAASFASFTSVALPEGDLAGPVVLATLSGSGVSKTNNTGLWAVDSQGVFRLLLRTNDSVNTGTVAAPVMKTVKSITLLKSVAGVFGASRSFNDTGSVAAEVTYGDNTQSLLRLDIP